MWTDRLTRQLTWLSRRREICSFRFSTACGIEDQNALARCLRDHTIQLRATPWDPSGLNFFGTPDLPVTQIEKQQRIAAQSRAFLATWLEDHAGFGTSATSALRYVRAEFRRCGQDSALVWPSGHGLAIARRQDLGNWEAVKSGLQDRPFWAKLGVLVFMAGLVHFFLVAHWNWPTAWTDEATRHFVAISILKSFIQGVLYVALGATIIGVA